MVLHGSHGHSTVGADMDGADVSVKTRCSLTRPLAGRSVASAPWKMIKVPTVPGEMRDGFVCWI